MFTAKGIDFYKNKGFNGFAEAEETIKFTVLINNMFDALKRKYPAEGIKKNSRDLEVFYVFVLCYGVERRYLSIYLLCYICDFYI